MLQIDQDEKLLYNSRPWLGVRRVVVPKVDDSLDFTFRQLAVQPHDQSDSVDSTLNVSISEINFVISIIYIF